MITEAQEAAVVQARGKSPKFKRVIDRYDEPIINEGEIRRVERWWIG